METASIIRSHVSSSRGLRPEPILLITTIDDDDYSTTTTPGNPTTLPNMRWPTLRVQVLNIIGLLGRFRYQQPQIRTTWTPGPDTRNRRARTICSNRYDLCPISQTSDYAEE